MATTYKNFNKDDMTTIRTILHESVPITGALIVSGAYSNNNIKNFSHGLFQQVYDYPYLSSSANPIFDITVGYSNNSDLSSSTNNQNSDKINIYNQMAKILVGVDATGSVRDFDADGDLTGGTKLKEVIFINFARLLTKDGIKKGSFDLTLGDGNSYNAAMTSRISIKDTAATSSWKTNSPAGEYGILSASSATGSAVNGSNVGLVYYQAGIAVLTASLFSGLISGAVEYTSGSHVTYAIDIDDTLTGSAISAACDGFRQRWFDCTFNNDVELNSTIYFCRIGHNEFNYSSNPTYLENSKIRVKNVAQDAPVSYITGVGLYNAANELLMVAKLSEPLKKSGGESDITLRLRADF